MTGVDNLFGSLEGNDLGTILVCPFDVVFWFGLHLVAISVGIVAMLVFVGCGGVLMSQTSVIAVFRTDLCPSPCQPRVGARGHQVMEGKNILSLVLVIPERVGGLFPTSQAQDKVLHAHSHTQRSCVALSR